MSTIILVGVNSSTRSQEFHCKSDSSHLEKKSKHRILVGLLIAVKLVIQEIKDMTVLQF